MNRIDMASRATSITCVLALTATVAGACYMAATRECCMTYDVVCDNGADPAEYWTCQQSSNGSGWTVATARAWTPSDGLQNGRTLLKSGELFGSCQMTYRTCGPVPGTCIVQSPVTVECRNTTLTGDWCPVSP